MKKLVQRLGRPESGNAVVILALMVSVLIGFIALAVDTGVLYLENARLHRAVDAAALAGAGELPDTSKASALAYNYAQQNGIDTSDIEKFKVTFAEDHKKIIIEAKKEVGLQFAQILGFKYSQVYAKAAAVIAPVSRVKGLVPVGLDEKFLPLAPGHQYIIKVGSPDMGWTGVIAYPGQNGADDFRQSSRYGYNNPIAIGDNQSKATGNVTGPTIQGLRERISSNSADTWDNYSPDSSRVIFVPIYRMMGQGPNDPIKIVGFASVFLDKVVGTGNSNEVYVTYVNHTVPGDTDDTLLQAYLYSVKLVE